MSLNVSTARTVRAPVAEKLMAAQRSASLWKRSLAFIFGFCIEFNVLTGIGGAEASGNGLYGYRLLDFIAFGAVGLLGFYSLVPRRILSLAVYVLVALALFFPTIVSPESHSMILAARYMLYSVAALYVAAIISEIEALEWFCWGLIAGLLANIPIFIIQSSDDSSELIKWGLVPQYAQVVFWGFGASFLRYSGLYGHPNEAGHIAALCAAAGAYFAVAHRKFLPAAIVFVGLLGVFYYARSRAALFAGGMTLGLSLLIAGARITFFRFALVVVAAIVSVAFLSQLDFVASRFSDDPLASHSIGERMSTTLAGLRALLSHPFGMPIDEFTSYLRTETGFGTPHDGFILFGGVVGLIPLFMLLAFFAASLRVHDTVDSFFALLVAQVTVSFLFEQLSVSSSYQFAVCLIGARGFLRTRIGAEFRSDHQVILANKTV
jgi:hypothetical protein